MKTALYALLLAAAPLPGCSSGEESAAPVPGGKVEVCPVLPGLLGSVSENGPSVRTGLPPVRTDRRISSSERMRSPCPTAAPFGSM